MLDRKSDAPDTLGIYRRRVLKAGLGMAALFLPAPYAWLWAQSEGTMKLLRLPKLALVIGNSKYQSAPTLFNPGNDAKAMAETLRQSGFDVTAQLDAGQNDMAAAIRTYVQTLAAKKAVGLFYFAGHGVQLAWRNYLIPVDAAVRRPDDIQKSCIDLVALMDGINKASNPLNVVILDACRDNPFGGEVRLENRGLSQMDASHSTLLAYATAPGNVASDGEGANGLYTENLVREMRVPEARIEDVFKRVRLNVRRRSNGQQIPWESTSLEDDFYFIPPKELKRISDAEAKRLFDQELALWEKIKNAKEPEPLVDYLQRYPGGKFSELAQFQLDRVLAAQGEKKIEITSQQNNPFTQGTMRADTRFRVGDSYQYRQIDGFTGIARTLGRRTIVEIGDDSVRFHNGVVSDLLGNRVKDSFGEFTGEQFYIPEYSVGKRWTTNFRVSLPNGLIAIGQAEFRVVGRETVKVPAGSFDAFKIEGRGHHIWSDGSSSLQQYRQWVAPEVRLRVVYELLSRDVRTNRTNWNYRDELVSYQQA